MKVCILSMQRVCNYGSLLQAYSLKKILESLGHHVSFIDIEPNEEDNKKRDRVMHFDEGVKSSKKNIVQRFLQQDTCPFYAFKKIKAKKKQSRLQQSFANDVLELNDSNNNQEYDICVIGSDEVFNCLCDSKWGFTSQLFGNVRQADRVITYAASCGFTRPENLSKEVCDVIRNAFLRIRAFSVRDENTAGFVKSLSACNPIYSLDPVAIHNFDAEIEKHSDCLKKLPKKYCIVYAYYDRISSPDEVNAILKLCKEKHLVPISIGESQKWVHHHVALSPLEILCAFKNAEYVVTDTFHGAIFSAKYAKRFAVLVRESNNNKLSDLLFRLGIENHRAASPEMILTLYDFVDDKRAMRKIEIEQYRKSIEYLEQNI